MVFELRPLWLACQQSYQHPGEFFLFFQIVVQQGTVTSSSASPASLIIERSLPLKFYTFPISFHALLSIRHITHFFSRGLFSVFTVIVYRGPAQHVVTFRQFRLPFRLYHRKFLQIFHVTGKTACRSRSSEDLSDWYRTTWRSAKNFCNSSTTGTILFLSREM